MATRLFFPETEAAAVSPTIQGTYLHTNTVRRRLLKTADSSTLTSTAYTPDAADHAVAGASHVRQYVSDSLPAQTISGTWKAQIQGFEPNANCNQTIDVMIFVCSSDGTTIKETLFSQAAVGTELVATTLTNRTLTGSITSADIEADDRIVVQIGTSGTPGGGGGVQGHNSTLRWGCNASSGDLPENETETGTTFRPWIEFSSNLFTYTLAADSASYSITGSAATLLSTRKIDANAGVYAITGSAAEFPLLTNAMQNAATRTQRRAYVRQPRQRVIAAKGRYVQVATAQAFSLVADAATIAVTGQAATFRKDSKITADTAAIAITGQVANTISARKLTADSASIAITGSAVTFAKGVILTASSGSIAVTGNVANLLKATRMVADPGSYAIAGQVANLAKATRLVADAGMMSITGQAATFAKGVILVANTGSYALTGQAATFLKQSKLTANTGTYALTGNAATFVKALRMVANPASYQITGQAATLTVAGALEAKGPILVDVGRTAIGADIGNNATSAIIGRNKIGVDL